jgi:hypothetical protein
VVAPAPVDAVAVKVLAVVFTLATVIVPLKTVGRTAVKVKPTAGAEPATKVPLSAAVKVTVTGPAVTSFEVT